MGQKDPLRIERILYQGVLITWIISAVVMLFSLNSIDTIVNSELYDYGLQLSANWLLPYWTYIRLNYALLALPMILSLFVLLLGFRRKKEKVAVNETKQPKSRIQPVISRDNKVTEVNSLATKDNSNRLMFCSACGRKFSKALTLLNFDNGKSMIITVCPYCNHKLESEEHIHSQKVK